jgi:hypothetical protein
MKTMKTLLFSLTTLLVFYNTPIFASNPTTTNDKNIMTKSEARSGLTYETILQLAPVTPTEATFEDADYTVTNNATADQMKRMAPVTPKEAGFEEITNAILSFIRHPFTPKEATFEDAVTK